MAGDDDLIIKVGADTSELNKEFKKIGNEADKAGKDIEKSFKGSTKALAVAKKAAVAFAVAMVGVTAALKGVQFAIDKINDAKSLGQTAVRLGIAKSAFSELIAVGRRFGIETDQMTDAIRDLNERIADAHLNGGAYAENLALIGVKTQDLINLDAAQQFEIVADAISRMTNASKQNLVVNELMADSGFQMLNVFKAGEGTIAKFRKEVRASGEALSEIEFEDMEKAAEAVLKMNIQFEQLGKQLTIAVVPGLTRTAEALTEILEATNAFFKVEVRTVGLIEKEISALEKKLAIEQAIIDTKEMGSAPFVTSSGGIMMGAADQDTTGAIERAKVINAELVKLRLELMLNNVEIGLQEKTALATQDQADKDLTLERAKTQAEQLAIIKQTADKAAIANNLAFIDELENQEKRARDRNKMIWESGLKGKLNIAQSVLGSISVLMNTENRKQFEIGKAAAIADATINTFKSAVGAYSAMSSIPYVGPALGAAAAAAAVAAGIANVNSIKSQSFGGGGGGAPTTPAPGGGVGAGGGEAQALAEQPAPQNITQANITLQGDTFDQQTVRNLINSLNDQTDDNVELSIN